MEEEAKDFAPSANFEYPDSTLFAEVALGRLQFETGRAATFVMNFHPSISSIDYMSIGDMRLIHLRRSAKKAAEKADKMEKERDVTQREIDRVKKVHPLDVENIVSQTYFNGLHSEFVGQKGVKPLNASNKGMLRLKEGDYLILVNRGVGDSLFDREIAELVDRFDKLPGGPTLPEAISQSICEKGFNKIINFADDRPLVEKLKVLDVSIGTVSVDECYCLTAIVAKDE